MIIEDPPAIARNPDARVSNTNGAHSTGGALLSSNISNASSMVSVSYPSEAEDATTTGTSSAARISSITATAGQDAEFKELQSPDGVFKFAVSPVGHLFLYMDEEAIWGILPFSKTRQGPHDDAKFVLQGDTGNLVVEHTTRGQIWSSEGESGAKGPFRLVVQNDGNVVLFSGNGGMHWATGTYGWGENS